MGVRPVLIRCALVLGSLLVTALALEVLLRIAVPQWRGLVAQQFMTTTDGVSIAGVPNFDGRLAGLFGNFDVPLRFDARGFRNPPDADPAAPLAFIGDSFCQGWGVTREQSFPVLVGQRLGVPFYNYCTVGADLADYLNILRTWLPPRDGGTTVLTVTFENDVLAYPDSAADMGPTASVRGLSRTSGSRWLMSHSALFNVVTTLARQNTLIVALVHRLGLVSGVPVVAADGTDPIAASVRMIERIEQASGDGPFVVLMVPPRPGQVDFIDYDAFVAALVAKGFDVLDPRSQPGLTISTIPHDGHWDAGMHAAIAPLLADRIRAAVARSAREGQPVSRGPMRPVARAGTPVTTDSAGTSRVTTAPAPTTARSPTVTPGRMTQPAPR